MIIRNDVRSSVVIPQELKDTILRVGGRNIYDEPLFRVILAQDRYTKASGAWAIWPEEMSLDDRGGLGVKEMQEMLQKGASAQEISDALNEKVTRSPLRVDRGLAEVPVYPYEGFILERWKPAHMFGSPRDWYSYTFEGEAALGPYPSNGDYEHVAGPTPYMPTSAQLQEAIQRHFKEVEEKPKSPAQRVLLILERREQETKRRKREMMNKIQAINSDSPASLYKTVSLGAGRVRNELAQKAGLKGHYGN